MFSLKPVWAHDPCRILASKDPSTQTLHWLIWYPGESSSTNVTMVVCDFIRSLATGSVILVGCIWVPVLIAHLLVSWLYRNTFITKLCVGQNGFRDTTKTIVRNMWSKDDGYASVCTERSIIHLIFFKYEENNTVWCKTMQLISDFSQNFTHDRQVCSQH